MTRTPAIVLSLLVFATLPALGQLPPCPGDDGFNPGCCQQPQPNLASFPSITSSGAYACINACIPNSFQVQVTLSAPQFVLCDYALMNITVNSPAIVGPNFSGVVLMKYARTWREFPTTATTRQVWRFLINSDVNFVNTAATTPLCPTPPCALPPNNLPVHMVGNIDYALDCPSTTTNAWSIALTLTHSLGCFFHAGFSQRPLAGPAAHDNTAYVLVAPGNFIFGNVVEPMGPIVADSTRSSLLSATPFQYQCLGETRVGLGTLQTTMQDCYTCTPILPIAALWKHQQLNSFSTCGAITVIFPFNSFPIPGLLPTGLVAMSIGSWVGINPLQFPVGRDVVGYLGVLQYNEPCLPQNTNLHVVTGVGHTSPTPAALFSPSPVATPVRQFVDLENMLVLAGPNFVPGIGALFASDEIWNLNMP